ncbi:pyridoxal phosphate-dependent aminotransferase [Conexivisphaera calida]|uniref:Aminotransferase n=1 Tax=Conexivisphaera calida TaxID=1874277 RepID=A0A4P2VKW9_9ARCH|nr:pyridoxal phosphate-dependent aminotransferase [Conexivisphaera calida]BBE41838.1 Aspartate aminotransferase [Conexivisphaera calida]
MARISGRLSSIKPSGVRELFDLAGRYPDVVNLTLGEPDVATPANVRDAARRALEEGFTHYTPNAGLPELRRAISERYARDYGAHVDQEEVLVTQGGSQAILEAMAAVMDEGDSVLVPTPAFVGYAGAASLLGIRTIEVETSADEGFTPTVESLRAAADGRTRAIIVNSPGNPTGAVYSRRAIEEIISFAEERDLWIISDEVYEKFIYGAEFVSLSSFDQDVRGRTIIVNSFSKTYAMTGWRLGYMIAPRNVVEAAVKFQMYDAVCPSSIAQRAALEALRGPQDFTSSYVAEVGRRLDYAYSRLSSMRGVRVVRPRGAFYIFPGIDLNMSSAELARALIQEERVAVVPGSAFGRGGEGHIRISLAASMDAIGKGLDGLERFLNKHG